MDVFRQSSHSNPWRSVFEINAGVVWLICAFYSWGVIVFTHAPPAPFYVAITLSIAFAILRTLQAMEIWNLRINLLGKGMLLTSLTEYLRHCTGRPNDLWLGLGFAWKKHHTQRLYDMSRSEEKQILPPEWYSKLRGKVFEQQSEETAGFAWIHGLENKETEIHLPFSLLEGNSIILGTTGAGKSTLLRCIIAACIRRGDVVICIDPKGDRSLVDAMQRTCAETPGRERDFVFFHTAFPSRSCRYDVLKNFDRVTSIASRISAQIPSKNGTDQFVAFAWRVLMVYSFLLVACGERPTIGRIRRNVETGVEPLLERALLQYFDQVRPSEWRTEAERFIDMAANDRLAKPSRSTPNRLVGYVEYYKVILAPANPSEAIDAGINMYNHDRAHFGKMLSSLLPTLAMLDAGELGAMLSPRYDDIDDPRDIYDSEKVIEGGKCIYIGTDALSDSVTSSAIASTIVSDLASYAGSKYNYGKDEKPRRITLIVDEANEVVSAPFHQLASKGRGSGFTLWAASQTIPDYVARLGSEDKALATLGNFNNLICLRIKDEMTANYVAGQFGETFIDTKSYGLNTSSQSDSAATGFTGGEGVTVSDNLNAVIPPDILYKLPNHQYFAMLAGGKLYKGRQNVLY